MWDLPRPGLEPVSPALAGRLLNHCTTREAPRQLLIKLCLLHSIFFMVFAYMCLLKESCFWVHEPSRILQFTLKIEHSLKQNLQHNTLNISLCWKQKNNIIYFHVITPDLNSKYGNKRCGSGSPGKKILENFPDFFRQFLSSEFTHSPC